MLYSGLTTADKRDGGVHIYCFMIELTNVIYLMVNIHPFLHVHTYMCTYIFMYALLYLFALCVKLFQLSMLE